MEAITFDGLQLDTSDLALILRSTKRLWRNYQNGQKVKSKMATGRDLDFGLEAITLNGWS